MDIDTRCRMAENELRGWIDGHTSTANIVGAFYSPEQGGARYIAIEQADAATIQKLTAALQALYTIREGQRP